MKKQKIIHDSIYGSIKLGEMVSDIISTREFQRLNSVKQLGFSYLVFPGATHTRFEHSLGTYYLTYEAARNLELEQEDIEAASLAGLMHDIGHGPFSHTTEDAMKKLYGMDHLDISIGIISGKIGTGRISNIISNYLEKVINILKGKEGILSRLISGNGDMDQIDYLARDSYYTGVALGMVDSSRILNTIAVANKEFCVMEKGLPAMEGLMLARMLMYRTVYRHRTSLVASVLANEALEIISPPLEEFVEWNDYDFMAEMKKNEKTRDIYDMLKFRNLPSGLTLNLEEKYFDSIVSGIMDKITYHKYFKSPYKREVVKILVRGEMKPITEESGIMEYLERELTGTGLLVFDKSNGDYIKKYLDKQDVKYQ